MVPDVVLTLWQGPGAALVQEGVGAASAGDGHPAAGAARHLDRDVATP